MAQLNPDFRGADEVVVPSNLSDMTGWNPEGLPTEVAIDQERLQFDYLQSDLPMVFRTREQPKVPQPIWDAWVQFQKDKGRYEGSADWTLLDEFCFKKKFIWLPQKIGSCVWSNTFRAWVIRATWQVSFFSGEHLGQDEFGATSIAPYGGFSYGMMRKRGGLRGGDGGFCAPMAESLIKDGILPCQTPQLLDLLRKLGADGQKDFPEPQNNAIYRQFGDWKYIDDLGQYAKHPLLECPQVESADQLWDLMGQCKPAFVCSGIAIKKIGTHKDGFAIHARNPSDSWAHNMCFHGRFVASDGARFFRESNESWGEDTIYNVPFEEIKEWFDRKRVSSNAIGQIEGLNSYIPVS